MASSLGRRSRRRRRLPPLAAAILLSCSSPAIIASATSAHSPAAASPAAAEAEGDDHHLGRRHEKEWDGKQQQQQQQQYSRRLQERKEETLSRWRALQSEGYDLTKLRPLDLVLDDTTTTADGDDRDGSPPRSIPRAYQKGGGGFLEPYDMYNYQDHFVGRLDLGLLSLQEGEHSAGVGDGARPGGAAFSSSGPHHHGVVGSGAARHESGRIGVTNFDLGRGIGASEEAAERRAQGNSRGGDGGRSLRGPAPVGTTMDDEDRRPPRERALIFKYSEGNDLEEEGVVAEGEVPPSPREQALSGASPPAEDGVRLLQSISGSYHSAVNYHAKSSDAADGFADGGGGEPFAGADTEREPADDQRQADDPPPVGSDARGPPWTPGEDIEAYRKNGGGKNGDDDSSPPVIRATFPPENASIGARQSFGALVSDVGGSGVKRVCVQFRDHGGNRSECFPLQNVGGEEEEKDGRRGLGRRGNNDGGGRSSSDIWELSVEGFGQFAGESWMYRIRSTDGARNKRNTSWTEFRIDERAAGGDRTTESGATSAPDGGSEGDNESSGGSSSATAEKLEEEVGDEDWPHGGIVQYSTGRILFFFDGNPYVCTGTVLEDPVSDRTIILTAGHCAYQHRADSEGGGRFAEHALYIPNQVDTRGRKSNEACSDDPLGCWIPAFAVVDYEWTTRSFPQSVPWDYGYYVVPNDPGSHEGGFIHEGQPDLSTVLEELVEPIPIDFGYPMESGDVGDFTHGLGYSFDKDPAFRYCAGHVSTRYGIDSYENLWLGTCEMSGGSSGGPWMMDVDTEGRGTVISINSWGYATSTGMAGPNFDTGSGSKAECLYERARDVRFEDVLDRGVVVHDC